MNLIGEHTDYNDGFVLPFAIDRTTTVAMAPRRDDRVRLVSTINQQLIESDLDAIHRGMFTGWSAYPLGVAWAFVSQGWGYLEVGGFDLAVHSIMPVGARLSSSAALEMGVAVALNEI